MTVTTFCQLSTAPNTRVTAIGTVGVDAYQTVLTVPASVFTAGHEYYLITSGIVGKLIARAQPPASNIYCDVVPYVGSGYPFGSYLTAQAFRCSSVQPDLNSVPSGLPFLSMKRVASWTASDVFQVLARTYNPNGILGDYSFEIDSLAVLVWDLTSMTAAGLRYVATQSDFSPVHTLPGSSSAASLEAGITGTNSGLSAEWLVFWAGTLQPRNDVQAARLWAQDGTAAYLKPNRLGCVRRGQVTQSGSELPSGNQWPVGTFVLKTLASSWAVNAMVQDEHNATPHSGLASVGILAVQNTAELQVFTEFSPSLTDFWGRQYPWDGTSLTSDVDSDYYYSTILGAAVDAPPLAGNFGTVLESDGVPQQPGNPFYCATKGIGVENPTRHHFSALTINGGVNHLVLRGGRAPWQATPATQEDGYAFVMGWKGRVGEIPLAPPYIGPGPETQITPRRETTVAIASLPALPFHPSVATQMASESPVRRVVTPSGYVVSHPRFSSSRKVVRLVYSALSAADSATLRTFIADLATNTERGAFRWQPPWELAAQAWALVDSASVVDRDLGLGTTGPRAFEFDVIQLTGATP